jgi:holliday junction DNA helicase RuvA
MIEYIKGILISKSLTEIIVETGGLGYNIRITLPAYDSLPDINEEVKIITHLHIKENPFSLILYGFSDEKERECFRLIISVSGVGPKTAISILSAIGYRELTKFIASGDFQHLTSISGVGKKTAERLMVELKDKLLKPELALITKTISSNGEPDKLSEIAGALLSLGYNRIEAEKMIRKVSSSVSWKELSVEDIIKEILRGK